VAVQIAAAQYKACAYETAAPEACETHTSYHAGVPTGCLSQLEPGGTGGWVEIRVDRMDTAGGGGRVWLTGRWSPAYLSEQGSRRGRAGWARRPGGAAIS
jgi:hypothetical protein